MRGSERWEYDEGLRSIRREWPPHKGLAQGLEVTCDGESVMTDIHELGVEALSSKKH